MRVLVVEDARPMAETLEKGLREQGYAVDVALDGEKGLELAEINQYDVIVLDIMLPRRDGLSVCRALRGQGLRSRQRLSPGCTRAGPGRSNHRQSPAH